MAVEPIKITVPFATPTPFLLVRSVDVSGVSGTGVVAEGVQFTDGTCVVRWRSSHRSTVVWESIDAVVAIHGHDGATRIEWI